MAGFQFEWDPRKAVANWQKHGVSFEEAMIISARRAEKSERDQYGAN